mgnify:CR=1 FL=1
MDKEKDIQATHVADKPMVDQLAQGLAKLRQQIVQPATSKKVEVTTKSRGKYSYSYTPLDKIIEAVDNAAKGTGITYTQHLKMERDALAISTIIMHESGQSINTGAVVLQAAGTPQAIGSAITYARRYSLSLAFGVASDSDDDAGEAAEQRQSAPQRQPQSNQPPRQQAPQRPSQPAYNQPPLQPQQGPAMPSQAEVQNFITLVNNFSNNQHVAAQATYASLLQSCKLDMGLQLNQLTSQQLMQLTEALKLLAHSQYA